MENNQIYNPLDEYKSTLKSKMNEEASSYFESLVKEAKVDPELNKRTVEEYRKLNATLKVHKDKLNNTKGLKAFLLTVGIILLIAFTFTLFFIGSGNLALVIILAILFFAGGIASILVAVTKLKDLVALREKKCNEIENQVNEKLGECYTQMEPLNNLYDYNMQIDILKKVIPIVKLDKYLDIKKYEYMAEKYNLGSLLDKDSSMYFMQSGEIVGNPFLLCKTLNHHIIDKVYTGSLTIHWTEYNGKNTVHRSQTLVANYVAPAPDYYYTTNLIYTNDAAPDLNFSRTKSSCKGMDEKKIDKMIVKEANEIRKYAEKNLMQGGSFTQHNNDDFEVLFHALDRNNEQQFRLLFTPMAQINITKLIRNQEPFGDDFSFKKMGPVNFITSDHSQVYNYDVDPRSFRNYCLEDAKTYFLSRMNSYFDNFYFDIAPLLSIPLYQQYKTQETIFKNDYQANFSPYEHDVVANSFDPALFAHEETTTMTLLKTRILEKNKLSDKVEVNAYSYKGEPRIAYVEKRGGDGHWHSVPVHWVEYFPLEKTSVMEVKDLGLSRFNFNSNVNSNENVNRTVNNFEKFIFLRGLFAGIINDRINYTESDDDYMTSLFESLKNKEEKNNG